MAHNTPHSRALAEQTRLENEAELAARDATLFGPYLKDVQFLRTRDFTIQREGSDFIVDDRRVDGATLHALADRERRLLADRTPPANDEPPPAEPTRQIGDVVALKPRPAPRAAARPIPPAQPSPAPVRLADLEDRARRKRAVAKAPAPKKAARRRLKRRPARVADLVPEEIIVAIIRDLRRLVDALGRRR